MRPPRVPVSVCCWLALAASVRAQDASIAPVRPHDSIFVRPYQAPSIPPAPLNNTGRLSNLIRNGILYLTAQDAIALALENNIDLEVARYNPIIADWNLERAQAGGALPGVPSLSGQAGAVANGQGVLGSQAAAGVTGAGFNGGGPNTGNATISEIGPITQTLDPSIQESSLFSHVTTPQPNATQSQTLALVDTTHVYNLSIQQGFVFGGSATLSYSDHYLKENAVTDQLNPTSAPNLSLSLQQNLLRGFGSAVGGRTIRVNRINLQVTDLNFRSQVIATVANVLNQYYSLAADYEDLAAKQRAYDTAQQFYRDTQRQEELGALSQLDVTTAASQVASTQAGVVASQTALHQDELTLKNTISRTGAMDPLLSSAQIVTLDRITVPASDNLPPLDQLLQQALNNRPDLAAAKLNVTTAEISALGTANGVLPSLTAFGSASNAGLSGQAPPRAIASPKFVGGIGTALEQVFTRDYPTERIGVFAQVPLHNRQAEADQAVDQLQLRQTQLTTEKSLNQVIVDISNGVVAVRQARVRYAAAAANRQLQQQLLDAEQRKFLLGASTPYNVTQQQRDLATASATEVSSLAQYSAARVALDQALGTTLEVNHVSIDEAKSGNVARPSSLPATLPPNPAEPQP